MAGRSRHVVPITTGLVPALLFGSIMLGAKLPADAPDGRRAGLGGIDLSRGPAGGFGTLRDGFIADVLGRALPRPADAGSPAPEAGTNRRLLPRPGDYAPVAVSHDLTNDDRAKAYEVPSVPFTARTDTTKATRESWEPTGCAPVGGTIWYRFTPRTDVGLIADSFGTNRPATIGVFTGDDLVGCSTHPRGNAQVAFAAVSGTTYLVQVVPVSPGPVTFGLRPQGETTRVKETDGETAAGTNIVSTNISPTGRWLLFGTMPVAGHRIPPDCVGVVIALPLIPGLCRGQAYVLDRTTGRRTLVSVNSHGEAANDLTIAVSMSEDGRYVVLSSLATNLVPDDLNTCRVFHLPGQCPDVFVHDRDADEDGVYDETHAGARSTMRISVAWDGTEGNGWSGLGYISRDGRYVAFQSDASNLVAGDTNGMSEPFVHDRDTDQDGIFDEPGAVRTIRVAVSTSGRQAVDDRMNAVHPGRFAPEDGHHYMGSSSNGRYVLFRSAAANLVPGDTNGVYDVFLRDLVARTTVRVNVGNGGAEANGGTRLPNGFRWSISDDGRYALFNSDATNLVPGDTNNAEDLFVRDLVAGTTERVTVADDGSEAVGEAPTVGQDAFLGIAIMLGSAATYGVYTLSEQNRMMTPDGRYVFFSSGATNLVPEDDNDARDMFVRDRLRGTTTLLSVSTTGRQGNATSNNPSATVDGSMVFFSSASTNLEDETEASSPGLGVGAFLRTLPWATRR